MNYRNIAERAAWTFVQAFLAVYVVTDSASAKAGAVAGVAAVLSLVKNIAADRLGPQ